MSFTPKKVISGVSLERKSATGFFTTHNKRNTICRVESTKVLGVMVDSHLNFRAHADYNNIKTPKYVHIFLQNSENHSI